MKIEMGYIELDWDGLGDPEGTDVAVCTAPFQSCVPHFDME